MGTVFTIILGIAVIVIVLGLIGYMITTNSIIREQEKEITQLRAMLKAEKEKEPLVIEKNGRNPEFGGF